MLSTHNSTCRAWYCSQTSCPTSASRLALAVPRTRTRPTSQHRQLLEHLPTDNWLMTFLMATGGWCDDDAIIWLKLNWLALYGRVWSCLHFVQSVLFWWMWRVSSWMCRTCLRYFLPPQWIMDKENVSQLSMQELVNFPLDDFFDHYERGLRKVCHFRCLCLLTSR